TELLLLLIGGIFVVEALSVILQVLSFRYWGRRVFLMAPIHYHFAMKAWSETKIMVRFWILAPVLCAAAVALYYRYYLQFRGLRLGGWGQGGALALRRRGEEVIGVDASPEIDAGRLAEAGVEVHLGTEEERLLDGVETLVKSPGVPGEAPFVQAARERGIP